MAFLYSAVHPRIAPLSGPHGKQVGDVIVRHGPPEIRLWRGLNHFPAPVPVGHEASVEDGEQDFEIPAPCTDIVPSPYDLRLRDCGPDRPGMSRYQLAKSYFMAFGRPGQRFLQAEGNRQRVLSCPVRNPERERHHTFRQRFHAHCHGLLFQHFSVLRQRHDAVIRVGIGEQVPVPHGKAVSAKGDAYVPVIEFYFLHLRRGLTAASVHDAVAAESEIGRPLPAITAIPVVHISKAVGQFDALIHKIPDESALVQRLLFRQVGIFMHRSAGVAHRMAVLTADVGLIPVLPQEFPDLIHRYVHGAFHIACAVVPPVMENALVLHEPRLVKAAEQHGFLV